MSLTPRRVARRATITVAAAALLLAVAPNLAQASTPGKNGRIAFEERGAIYTVLPNGSGVKRITTGTDDHAPSWSPDGKTIAFERAGDLWLMRADGTHLSRLTSGPGYDTEPDWSPDGAKIVFVRSDDASISGRSMFVKPVAGGLPTRLTPADDGCPTGPTWTPDNRYVVFGSECSFGNTAVRKVRVTTGAITDVVPVSGVPGPGGLYRYTGTTPDVTPDSQRAVFQVVGPNASNQWVASAALDGSGLHLISGPGSSGETSQDDPSVSPDGKLVAWTAGADELRIEVAKVNGTVEFGTRLYDGFWPHAMDWQAKH